MNNKHLRQLSGALIGLPTALWVLYSLLQVSKAAAAVAKDTDLTWRIMSANNSGEISSALGLTYHGVLGVLLAVAQVALVITALVSIFKASFIRRLYGAIVLCGWAALWFGNVLWLRNHGYDRAADLPILGAVFGLSLVWSVIRLTGWDSINVCKPKHESSKTDEH